MTDEVLPREAVRGVALGLVPMGVFTGSWAWWPYSEGVPEAGMVVTVIFLAFAAVLLVHGIAMFRALTRFPPAENTSDYEAAGRRFNVIFAAEGAAIAVASIALGHFGLSRLEPFMIAAVVGLHFIPLAGVFRRRLDLWMGAITATGGIVGLVVVAARPDAGHVLSAIVEYAMALVTSVYGAVMLDAKRNALRLAARA